jgi:hypothetical protein
VIHSKETIKAMRMLATAELLLMDAKLMNDAVEGYCQTKHPASVEWDGCLGGISLFNNTILR